MTCRTLMGGPLAKSTAHVGDHSRLTGPQLKEHGTGIRSPPLVAERSTRHAATSEERPQKKDGAQSRTQQSRYRQPMQQITHVSKQRRNLNYYYYYYYRLLLVSVQQTNSWLQNPFQPCQDLKGKANKQRIVGNQRQMHEQEPQSHCGR